MPLARRACLVTRADVLGSSLQVILLCFLFLDGPVVTKRFGFREGSIELYAERVLFRGLSAVAQAESLKYKLLHGLAVRRFVRCMFGFLLVELVMVCSVS